LEKLNVVVLTEDMDLRIHVKNRLSSDAFVISGYSDFSSAAMLKIESMFPDVILCAVKGGVDVAQMAFIQNIYCTVVGCVLILMTDSMSVDLVNRAAQAGIRQVVQMDIEPQELTENITVAASLERQRSSDLKIGARTRSRVIGFFCGKGGTGKTTMAVNTAVALAKKGKRVMLIDCDLQFGDVNLLLDLEPKDTIVELVQERGGIMIDNIRTFSMVHSSGVNVLCAPKSAEFAELVTARHIETIIDVLRPYFDFIIVDMPPTFNDVSIAAIENCDELMLIYNLEILSLKNAKVCLDILEQIQQKDKAQLIINKNINSLIKIRDFENMFDQPVFGTVTNDVKTANICLNKGQPIVIAMPKTPIAKEMMAVAQKILIKA
jgi:pilus assembly protein CpaE